MPALTLIWLYLLFPMAVPSAMVDRQCSYFSLAYKGGSVDCLNASEAILDSYLQSWDAVAHPVHDLRIRYSNISTVLPHMFNAIRADVHSLQLPYNNIRRLNDGAFCRMFRLIILRLDHNAIHNIKLALFLDLKALIVLDLSHNMIPSIENAVFTKLPNLQSLHLNNNNIMKLGVEAFYNVYNLVSLDLSYNKLTDFPMQCLEYILRLEQLNLSFNKLRSFDLSTIDNYTQFFPLSQTRTLDLSGNHIVYFELKFLDKLPELQTVDLMNNKLNCSSVPDMLLWFEEKQGKARFHVGLSRTENFSSIMCIDYVAQNAVSAEDEATHELLKYVLCMVLVGVVTVFVGVFLYRICFNRKRYSRS